MRIDPGALLGVYNACLRERCVPEQWKMVRLVLMYKGNGKPVTVASSYRPLLALCMINNMTKLLGRLLLP